jgi:hypothetical protein
MSVASILVSRVPIRPVKADKRGSYVYDKGGTQLAQHPASDTAARRGVTFYRYTKPATPSTL